jgi:hypothetical protein
LKAPAVRTLTSPAELAWSESDSAVISKKARKVCAIMGRSSTSVLKQAILFELTWGKLQISRESSLKSAENYIFPL